MKNKFSGKFPKMNKQAGWNKAVRAGIFQKINELCSMCIRQTRVPKNWTLFMDDPLAAVLLALQS